MKQVSFLIGLFLMVACGGGVSIPLTPSGVKPECLQANPSAEVKAQCGAVASGSFNEVIDDENAIPLDLSVNPETTADLVTNSLSLGVLSANSRTTRTFTFQRSDQGELSLLKPTFSGVCARGVFPAVEYALFEETKKVRYGKTLFKAVSIQANKKYFLRLTVPTTVICTDLVLNLVVDYKTDGVEVPNEVKRSS
ncbi:MAG: hypothetical protein AB7F59_00720 [Bdellovibrionales bacterium]